MLLLTLWLGLLRPCGATSFLDHSPATTKRATDTKSQQGSQQGCYQTGPMVLLWREYVDFWIPVPGRTACQDEMPSPMGPG